MGVAFGVEIAWIVNYSSNFFWSPMQNYAYRYFSPFYILPPSWPHLNSHSNNMMDTHAMRNGSRLFKKSKKTEHWFSKKKDVLEIELATLSSSDDKEDDLIQSLINAFHEKCENILRTIDLEDGYNERLHCKYIVQVDNGFISAMEQLQDALQQNSTVNKEEVMNAIDTVEMLRGATRNRLKGKLQAYKIGMTPTQITSLESAKVDVRLEDDVRLLENLKRKHANLNDSWAHDKPIFLELLDLYASWLMDDHLSTDIKEQVEKKISKLYKSMALKYHPDKCANDLTRLDAKTIFQTIGQCLEEFRQRFESKDGVAYLFDALEKIQIQINDLLARDDFWKVYAKTQQKIFQTQGTLANMHAQMSSRTSVAFTPSFQRQKANQELEGPKSNAGTFVQKKKMQRNLIDSNIPFGVFDSHAEFSRPSARQIHTATLPTFCDWEEVEYEAPVFDIMLAYPMTLDDEPSRLFY